MTRRHLLFADGAARGNPGPAAIGFVLYDPDGESLAEIGGVLGETTNNVAEYRALIAGLELALDRGVEAIDVRVDSLLLVKQIAGEYRVKASHLKPLHREALRLLGQFGEWSMSHVRREANSVADGLANEALDGLR